MPITVPNLPPRPAPSIGKKLAFSLVTACALLVMVEVGWRLAHGWNRDWVDFHRHHPDLGWCLREGWIGRHRWLGGQSRIDARGIRADEPIQPKKPGEKRLLALGASVTFGAYVRTAETWPAQLDRRLQDAGNDWRVLNGGVNGYDPAQEVEWLEHFGWDLEPDALAITFCLRKVHPSRRHSSFENEPAGNGMRWLTEHSILAYKLQRASWHVQARMSNATALQTAEDERQGPVLTDWPLVEHSYRRLALRAREKGLPVVLIVFPTLDLLEGRDADRYTPRLQKLGNDLGWIVLDVRAAFQENPGRWFVPGDPVHPNAAGYRCAAARIEAALQECQTLR
jgi:lysophospholipase L1-like esterase